MANLVENINRAIADFDSIKTAIEDKGIDVGNAPTSEYGNKIAEIQTGGQEIYFNSGGQCYIKDLTFPANVTSIGNSVYSKCNVVSLTIHNGITSIGYNAFNVCSSLISVYIANSVTSIGTQAFGFCKNIESIILEKDIDCTGLNFSWSTKLTAETMVAMLEALKNNTGVEAKTITLGATNLAKLTAEQIQIATNKNWNVA